jgi:large conductance mechanosensitive channel
MIRYIRTFMHEFRAFAVRGNVIDLAVAVVIGGAFGKIVTSLVDNIITPTIGLLIGGIDFSSLSLKVGSAILAYGKFIQSVIDFVVVAFVIFLVVKGMNRLHHKKENAPEKPKESSEEVVLLREIRDLLKK